MKENKYMESVGMMTDPKRKTKVFAIASKLSGACLGYIKWYAPWRQYCFFPGLNTVFSNSCLQCLLEFVKDLTEERKGK